MPVSRVPGNARDAQIAKPATAPAAGPPPSRRVWLDLLVPGDVDVERLLTDCAGRARLVVQSDPTITVGELGVGVFYAETLELAVDGFYVEAYCRVCGCTDTNGCGDGCWWVEPDLCSACADSLGLVDPRPVRDVAVQGAIL